MQTEINAFMLKHGFVRAEWDWDLVFIDTHEEPFYKSEYMDFDMLKAWYDLEDKIRAKYGVFPYTQRLEWELDLSPS